MDDNIQKKDAEKAFREATAEQKEKQIANLKQFITKTLDAISHQNKIRDEANKRISILKKDLDDLKEGRLDRIEERQKKDPETLKVSVATVEREIHHHHHNGVKEVHHYHHDDYRWYDPWRFTWIAPYCGNGTIVDFCSSIAVDSGNLTLAGADSCFTINNSVCADYTKGCYELNNGSIKNL